MATDTRTLATSNTTDDATFRAWGKSISDCVKAAALTAHTDTAQIDWTTVTRPAVSTYAGYEIFKLTTDTQNSTLGCYIKLEYGQGATLGYAALRIQVGTGTNGAGTLTGQTGTQRTAVNFSTGASGTAYCSGGDGRFCFVGPWVAGTTLTAGYNTIFLVERLRDNTGAVTADGIYTFFAGQQGTTSHTGWAQTIRSSYASTVVTNKFGAMVQNQTGNFGSDYYLNTHHPHDQGLGNPILSNLFYYYTDLNSGSDITVPMYGTNRTYKPLGQLHAASTNYGSTMFGHNNAAFAILWE